MLEIKYPIIRVSEIKNSHDRLTGVLDTEESVNLEDGNCPNKRKKVEERTNIK